jgi:hypothetical protein
MGLIVRLIRDELTRLPGPSVTGWTADSEYYF